MALDLVVDMHSDVPIDVARRAARGERGVMAARHLPRWRKGGVTASILAVGGDSPSQWLVPDDPEASARATLRALLDDIAGDPRFLVVREWTDLARVSAEGPFGIVIALEGCAPLDRDIALLDEFHGLGLRSLGLTWNPSNRAGDGLGGTRHGGLSAYGREIIRRANELGILVDLSHAAPSTFWAALEASARPCFVSHANMRALCGHARNITDEQVRAVALRGGLVGIACYPEFVVTPPGKATIDDVLAHVRHAAEVAGARHVGFGTDFVDFAPELILGALSGHGVEYAATPDYPTGIETVESFGNLVAGLRDRLGYGEEAVRGIAGQNFFEFAMRHA